MKIDTVSFSGGPACGKSLRVGTVFAEYVYNYDREPGVEFVYRVHESSEGMYLAWHVETIQSQRDSWTDATAWRVR